MDSLRRIRGVLLAMYSAIIVVGLGAALLISATCFVGLPVIGYQGKGKCQRSDDACDQPAIVSSISSILSNSPA